VDQQNPGRRRLRRLAVLAVPAVIAFGAGGAIAAASASDPGVIKACESVAGILRVADACNKGETPLQWNVAGPQGAAGPQGPAGPAGSDANVVGGSVLAGGDADIFAKLDGIPGDSQDADHPGEIEVKAFHFRLTNSGGSSSGGGGGAGKATFDDVHIEKVYDASSPLLFQHAATGEHIKSAVLTFRRPGPQGATFVTYTLSDVTVTGYEQGGTEEKPGLEGVDLSFAKVQVAFQPAGGGAPITAGWDVKGNVAA
jgi:type VI secretion system secreted protein Hcp